MLSHFHLAIFAVVIKDRTTITQFIKSEAKKLGFMSCGIAEATFLEDEAPKLETWLRKGFHGEMHYMENHFDKRLDPRKLVEGARSVISMALNYYPGELNAKPDTPKISKYAYGTDYHFVIKDKLKTLLEAIRDQTGDIHGRAFVDSAPVLDKAWAKRSGIGWIGKNANLINKDSGSFFFLAELIIDLELDYDAPVSYDHCGTCTRCIDACPTDAIVAPYVVDGSRCISYLTIELKNEIPSHFQGKMGNWVFGCDICQDVCPWNKFSVMHNEPAFKPGEELLNILGSEWQEITEETFKQVFKHSAVKRTKYTGLKRNIQFLNPAD